jgi:hypothetical protein
MERLMFVSSNDFVLTPATHIVSLGSACKTAYNLRRYFDFGGAFPFDWWITKPEGLLEFLSSLDVELLYDPNLLELTPDGMGVTNRQFPIIFHHEFPRDWTSPGHPISADWRKAIEKSKTRTAALTRKLRALDAPGFRIAFFREGSMPTDGLLEVLGNTFSQAQWTFIHVPPLSEPTSEWRGDAHAWDAFLVSTALHLNRENHRPFMDNTDPTRESDQLAEITTV